LIGFVKKAVHPAARHVSRSPFKAEAVNAIIGMGGRSFARSHKLASPTDPAARWTAEAGGPAVYAYADNYLIDLKHA
jgi:hypothetical protein